MEPANIHALTQMFVNMVYTGHPIVAESVSTVLHRFTQIPVTIIRYTTL